MIELSFPDITAYIADNGFLRDTLVILKDSAMDWFQLIFGIVFELYAVEVLTSLQLAKLSLNNVKWTIANIGHFCEDGRAIDPAEHPV